MYCLNCKEKLDDNYIVKYGIKDSSEYEFCSESCAVEYAEWQEAAKHNFYEGEKYE